MMQEGGTSIRAFGTFGCWFAPVSSVVRRGDWEALAEPETCGRQVPQGVERAVVKISRTASNLKLFGHGQRVYEKGKRLGQSPPKTAICLTGRLEGWVRILK